MVMQIPRLVLLSANVNQLRKIIRSAKSPSAENHKGGKSLKAESHYGLKSTNGEKITKGRKPLRVKSH